MGNYDALPDAIKRELQLKGQGFEGKVTSEETETRWSVSAASGSGIRGQWEERGERRKR
ncbi:MAG: hypothetical protein IPL86_07580 [Flavobacteriales bacterium]|nr:hypothetical protein [Flavobacteriales bacterium]